MNEPRVDIIDIELIVVEDRAREDFGNSMELIASLKKYGLIQPVAVLEISSLSLNPTYRLLAGERRYRAHKEIGRDKIAANIYTGELSKHEIQEIELAENEVRKDFTWDEKAKLTARIHETKIAIHGEKRAGSRDTEKWSMDKTADMIGKSKTVVSDDIKLAQAIEVVPELANVENKSDALNMLKQLEKDQERQESAAAIEKERVDTPIDAQRKEIRDSYIVLPETGKLLDQGFFEGVQTIPSHSIDFIDVDWPFGVDLDEEKKGDTGDYVEIPKLMYPQFMRKTLVECYNRLKDDGWMTVWFGPEPWFEETYQAIIDTGFITNRMVCIWTKGQGQTRDTAHRLGNSYEMFYYVRKANSVINRRGRSNIFDQSTVPAVKKWHPTQKPVTMYSDVITTLIQVNKDKRFMVPFLGSGACLLAGYNLGMKGFGWDLSKKHKEEFIIDVNSGEPGGYQGWQR